MMTAITPVAALLLSVAFLLMGNGLQGTLLPVRASLEAFSTFDIGILGSSYFLGFAAGCVLGPFAVRRVGHIRAFTAMVSLASTTALAHVLVLSPYVWWPMRALTGFCFATLYMIIESWLNEKATNETRGFVFSVYTVINLTVITLGQMMLTLYDPATFVLFALASVLISVAAIPVALTTAAAPAAPATVRIRIGYLYRISPVGFMGALTVGFANGAFWSLGPLFAQRSGLSTAEIAVFMSVVVLGGAFTQWPLGLWSDRWDRRKVILAVCAGGALAGAGISVFPDVPHWNLLALAAGFGAFALPLYAICAAHMNDHVEAGGFVEAASGLLLLYAIGAVTGPILASGFMRIFDAPGLFTFTAAVHFLLACFTIYRMRMRPPVAEADRAQFADAAVMAQTVMQVDTVRPDPDSRSPEARNVPGLEPAETAERRREI